MLRLPRVFCPISLKFQALFSKHEQLDFSLLNQHDTSVGQRNIWVSLRVAVPTPRGKAGGRERRSLPPAFPRGVGTATRRLYLSTWQESSPWPPEHTDGGRSNRWPTRTHGEQGHLAEFICKREKYFLQYYNNHFRQFCFQSEHEVKGMFLFTIINFYNLILFSCP